MTEHQYPITLQADTVASFRRDGFVKTTDVLTAQEVSQYARAVDAEVARRTAADTRSVSDKTTYEQSLFSACDCGRPMPM